ncbi:RDD family protein [Sinomonas halotolerans]|uniref:RDD family protein n=1 Tax=Sinomonas halotolerans TaxID=1644133 RepID=A0ABU9WV70_9MICC
MVNLELVNASTGRRAGAKLIDLALLWVLQGIPFALASSAALGLSGSRYPTTDDQRALFAAAVWLTVGSVLGLALWIFSWAWEATTGKTPGQAMLGIRTSGPDGLAPGWGRVFVRNLVFGLVCLIPVAGTVLALVSNAFDANGKRQGWHDKAAKTFVFDVRLGRNPLTSGGINGPASFAPRIELPPVQQVVSPVAAASAGPAPVIPSPPAAPSPTPVPGPATAPAPAESISAPPAAPAHAAPAQAAVPAAATAPVAITPHPDDDVAATRVSSRARGLLGREGAVSGIDTVLSFSDGRSVALRGPVLVGRNPAAYEDETVQELVVVEDPAKSVSKTHLAVWGENGRVWVQDRKSTNGTRLVRSDGSAIAAPAGTPVEVDAGDVVHFGDHFFSIGRSRA